MPTLDRDGVGIFYEDRGRGPAILLTHGYGAMYSYAYRIEPNDRWAVAAYIRALQLSQNARAIDLPADGIPSATAGEGHE